MALSHRLTALLLLAVPLALAGCPESSTGDVDAAILRVDSFMPIVRCGPADDPDSDYISGMDEGDGDPDTDGMPNGSDPDSDGDGVSDVDEAGDRDCSSRPIDTDRDGTPDFLDLDSNGDGIPDAMQRDTDIDGDGIADVRDADVDGDAIPNVDEFGPGPSARDTDSDGIPDVIDGDSDGDTIPDTLEGTRDPDGDMVPSYIDLDSDADGIDDAIEAGDGDIATPPVFCAEEIDPFSDPPVPSPDGLSDWVDADSDNDGFGDGEEIALGMDPCDIDSDDDGIGDLAEGAYERFNCPDPSAPGATDCGCATSASCGIPAEHFYVVLPFRDPPINRDLQFGTTIRVADVFFITDTTGSMGGTLGNVQMTVAASGGLIDRIALTIPDAWVGGGQHDDYPFGSYGATPDEPFILAIRMTPPSMAGDVRDAFNRIMLHGGGDGPESQTEALYQIVTGEGGTWMGMAGWGGGSGMYTMRRYVGDCLDGGWGAPCFRDAALPIVVLFTDICSHNGPPDDDLASCMDYTAITPAPATWADTIAAMNRRGAKFIGVNASGGPRCATVTAPGGYSPCWFLRRTAEETGSVDLDGNPLVYDLPNSADRATFTDTIVGAIETVATRVPLDVDTGLRDDPSDAAGVDARRFIKRRQPACITTGDDTCWVEPTGVEHSQAVATYDTSTFFGVVPGTLVTFTITFQNDFYPGGPTAELFIAFIDVRGGGTSVLDTRQVFVVVPANSGFLPG
jgi:hypothetical protein